MTVLNLGSPVHIAPTTSIVLSDEVESSGYTQDATAADDYTAFTIKQQDVTWSDGRTGHIDSIEVDGALDYYTASAIDTAADSCEIVVKATGGTLTTVTPDYYVDSVNGDDGNAGTSPGAAKATLAALPGLASGDVVAVASGSTFPEKLTAVAGVSYYRFGAGTKPIVDAGADFTNSSFVATGGLTNVYEQTVTIELHTSTSFVTVVEDGTMLTWVADTATCDTTPGSYTMSANTGSGDTAVTVYVHPVGSTNPTADGKTYRYSRRLFSIDGELTDSVTVDGIHTRHQTHNGGSIKVGRSATLRFCRMEYGNSHNVYISDGSTLSGCEAVDCEHDANTSFYICNEDTPAGLGVTYTHCAAKRTTFHDSLTVVGFHTHNNVSGTFGTVTFDTCAVVNLNVGFSGEEADTINITDPHVEGCNQGARSNSVPVVWNGGTWSGGNSTAMRVIHVETGTEDITLSGIDLSAATLDAMLAVYSTTGNAVTVTDCNFAFTSAIGQNRVVFLTDAAATLTATGNTYPDGWTTIYLCTNLPAANLSSDFNTFADDVEDLRLDGTSYSTVSAWTAATGNDANSTVGA